MRSEIPKDNAEKYLIGDWEVNFYNLSMKRSNQRVELTVNHYRLLRAFVDARDNELSMEEMGTAVYLNSIFEEGNVKKCLAGLRTVLGVGTLDEREYIRSLGGKRWKLIQEVRFLGKDDNRQSAKEFFQFFGESLRTKGALFVFDFRKAKKEEKWDNDFKPTFEPDKTEDGKTPRSEGVDAFLPSCDVRGMIAVANLLCSRGSTGFDIRRDDAAVVENYDKTCFSMGLAFNGYTKHLAKRMNRDGNIFFEILIKQSPKRKEEFITDNFSIGGIEPPPQDGWDYALVARIVKPDGSIRFCCSGRTGDGTTAAGVFLATKFPFIIEQFKKASSKSLNNDSIVVGIRHPTSKPIDFRLSEPIYIDGNLLHEWGTCPIK